MKEKKYSVSVYHAPYGWTCERYCSTEAELRECVERNRAYHTKNEKGIRVKNRQTRRVVWEELWSRI